MKTKSLLILLIVALVLAQTALAKGPPQKVTISGGDLAGEIEITDDETVLNALSMMTLEDYDTLTAEAPEGISGDGFLITRFYEDPPGRYFPFDQVRYYPDPEGRRGYLFYVGIVNGSSEYDGMWFRASEAGEAVLIDVLANAEPAASANILDLLLASFAALVGME
jgi:hypothetical protein